MCGTHTRVSLHIHECTHTRSPAYIYEWHTTIRGSLHIHGCAHEEPGSRLLVSHSHRGTSYSRVRTRGARFTSTGVTLTQRHFIFTGAHTRSPVHVYWCHTHTESLHFHGCAHVYARHSHAEPRFAPLGGIYKRVLDLRPLEAGYISVPGYSMLDAKQTRSPLCKMV
ncbi:hypothetical protein NDU88_005851 [Pleurodeles waltl]|uniref:Uncharacterized protein n=1 Tax=Pleurodeles waltl TaxID=8319 RepID=A0AAV7PJP8_PLEWA|nr:hypothetical protein NDU88_005851 [Pleurodeles waltl]